MFNCFLPVRGYSTQIISGRGRLGITVTAASGGNPPPSRGLTAPTRNPRFCLEVITGNRSCLPFLSFPGESLFLNKLFLSEQGLDFTVRSPNSQVDKTVHLSSPQALWVLTAAGAGPNSSAGIVGPAPGELSAVSQRPQSTRAHRKTRDSIKQSLCEPLCSHLISPRLVTLSLESKQSISNSNHFSGRETPL